MSNHDRQEPDPAKSEMARRIDSMAWALFFIWIGLAVLADMPWGWFFVGVGIVIFGAELARRQAGLKLQAFWLTCGAVFLAGGVWTLLKLPWPLAPILLILLGLILLGRVVFGIRR